MSANVKWPDFRLASTLRSLVGSQSRTEAPQAPAPDHDAPISEIEQRDLHMKLDPRRYADDGNEIRDPNSTMADPQPAPADGLSEFEGFEDSVGAADADFGTLEMFDSNASQAPFSSQLGGAVLQHAPEAPMMDEAPTASHKKSKRDKKNKKKKRGSDDADETPNPSSQAVESSAGALNGDEDGATPLRQSKKKRKLSDSVDGKRRKKRKSHEQETPEGAQANAFLRKGRGKANVPEEAIYEEGVDNADVPNSPSAARLRRRSQSRDAASRENSVPLATEADPMNVDTEQTNGHDKALVLDPPPVSQQDVESLAREAWNEHLSAEANPATGAEAQGEEADADQNQPSVYEDPVNPNREPDPTPPRRTRSTRKKAKPTFYEQPPPEEDDAEANMDALDELPSPSAMTPKPRRRAQKSSRGPKPKRPKAPKLSQSMRGGSDDDEETPRGRRNKMAGYTQGRFTDEELALIKKAVESFRDNNDLTQQQVNEMIQAPGGTTAGDEHAQLWGRIFAECPDRHRQKVINVARKKFHNFVARGTWTAEQDAELSSMIKQHGTKWSFIAGIINRHPEDVRDRYRNYIVCGDAQRKDAWDEEEEARLTQYVIEAMEAIDEMRITEPNREMLKRSYEELIDWQGISERMDRTRSRLQCITKWKWLHIRTHGKDQLASTQPDSQISFRLETARRQVVDMPEEEQYRLLLAIQNTGVGIDTKIPWQRLADKAFRNKWHRSTQVLLWRRLKQTVPDWETKSVRDNVQYLINQYNQTAEFPDVVTGPFDDTAEMALIQSLPSSSAPNGTAGAKNVSSEYVVDSDGEEKPPAEQNGEAVADGGDVVMQEDIQIDPALTEAPPQKETPGRKTPSKRGSKKKGKTAPTPTQDTIVDDDEPVPENAVATQNESDIDVEQFRKRKTPSKFKTSSARKTAAGGPEEQQQNASDSEMDDMADLPARIAA